MGVRQKYRNRTFSLIDGLLEVIVPIDSISTLDQLVEGASDHVLCGCDQVAVEVVNILNEYVFPASVCR